MALIYGRTTQHKEAIENGLATIYDEAAQIAGALKHYRVFLELGTKNDRLAQRAKVRIEELTGP